MDTNTKNLLRRTLAAFALLAAAGAASAQSGAVIKDDGTSMSTICPSWTAITPSASGGIVIKCPAPPPPPPSAPAGTFTIYGPASIDGTKNQYAWYSVARAAAVGGSTAGAATLALQVTGGCQLSPSSVSFADNSPSGGYQVFGVIAPQDSSGKIYNTTCVVSIAQQSPAISLGNPNGVSVTITGPGIAPGSQASCPALPTTATTIPLNYGGNDFVYLSSGQIGYSLLPSFSSAGAVVSGSAQVQLAITTASPRAGTYEISIGKCPGVIDPTGGPMGTCYKSAASSQSIFSLPWFEAPGANPAITDATANSYHICEAYAANGPWYVNIRYNYAPADCSFNTCDYAVNWAWSYFTP